MKQLLYIFLVVLLLSSCSRKPYSVVEVSKLDTLIIHREAMIRDTIRFTDVMERVKTDTLNKLELRIVRDTMDRWFVDCKRLADTVTVTKTTVKAGATIREVKTDWRAVLIAFFIGTVLTLIVIGVIRIIR